MSLLSLGSPDYWDERYKEEEKRMTTRFTLFDWYAPFESLYPTVETVIDTQLNHKVLIIGVGRSNMVEVLYSKGFKDITAIDISQTVIRQVRPHFIPTAGNMENFSYEPPSRTLSDATEVRKFIWC
jgi:2-polyprenyl-3-methyl-5-hydroxy-6-metoxy-1,4-benzoquinol methylase